MASECETGSIAIQGEEESYADYQRVSVLKARGQCVASGKKRA